MSNNPQMIAYLKQQYEKAHRFHSIFEYERGLTKREAHAAAFQALLAARQAAMEQQRR
jgi:hypothetical protein